jgi:hypothetical protein
MTPKRRLNILLTESGSQRAQPAAWLNDIPLSLKHQVLIWRAFQARQIPWLSASQCIIPNIRS